MTPEERLEIAVQRHDEAAEHVAAALRLLRAAGASEALCTVARGTAGLIRDARAHLVAGGVSDG